ncbi:MAG: hypothetical protein LBQ49_02200, partial [Rickettsiales bacterium]|nr:hypothetical protein [Rickettsiales bacterium]
MKKYDLFPGTVVGFYWWLVKKFRYYVFGLLFLLPLQNILGRIAPALVVRWVLDGITGADPNLPLMPQMTPVLLLVTATFLIVLIAEAASGYVESKYDPIVKVKVGEIVYRRLARQTVAFFKDHAAGFLVEQAGFIINRFRKIVVSHTYGLIALMGVLIVNSALMFQVHWAVAVLFMVCAGVRFGHCGLHTKGLWTAWVAAARYSAKVTASYVDSVSNFMNIKLFARRDAEARYLNKVRGEHARLRQIA